MIQKSQTKTNPRTTHSQSSSSRQSNKRKLSALKTIGFDTSDDDGNLDNSILSS